MFKTVINRDIILYDCLITLYLQPLNQVVFKPFKIHSKDSIKTLSRLGQGVGRSSRDEFDTLLNSAIVQPSMVLEGISAL